MAMQVRRGYEYEQDDDGLQQAWHNLHTAAQRSRIMSAYGDDGSTDGAQLDYVQYCQAAAACDPRLAGHLTASAFLRFHRSTGGTVSAAAVHEYLARRTAMLELWQRLAAFDEAGSGTLTGGQLAASIASLAAELPALQGLERHLPPGLYAAIAARKLLFFHGRAGRVRIRDLVLCPVLAELLLLPALGPPHPAPPQGGPETNAAFPPSTADRREADRTISAISLPSEGAEAAGIRHDDCDNEGEDCDEDGSWFAPSTAARLVDLFHDLAGDRGCLLPDDLVRFSGGKLTDLFAARVFEEHAMSSFINVDTGFGSRPTSRLQPHEAAARLSSSAAPVAPAAAMDLFDFLDFLLAWEHRGTPQGLRYFWAVLDVRRRGYLGKADLAAWFHGVHALWLGRGLYAELRVADVAQEVLDLAAPRDAHKITLVDLQRCGAGGTIVGMLADVAAFWEHDSKETLLAAEAGAAAPSTAACGTGAQLAAV